MQCLAMILSSELTNFDSCSYGTCLSEQALFEHLREEKGEGTCFVKRLIRLQPEQIFVDGDGNVTALAQFDQYVNRGPRLKVLSFYDYVSCIRMIRVKKEDACYD